MKIFSLQASDRWAWQSQKRDCFVASLLAMTTLYHCEPCWQKPISYLIKCIVIPTSK